MPLLLVHVDRWAQDQQVMSICCPPRRSISCCFQTYRRSCEYIDRAFRSHAVNLLSQTFYTSCVNEQPCIPLTNMTRTCAGISGIQYMHIRVCAQCMRPIVHYMLHARLYACACVSCWACVTWCVTNSCQNRIHVCCRRLHLHQHR